MKYKLSTLNNPKSVKTIVAALLVCAAAAPSRAATINYVGSLGSANVPEVNNWLTPSTVKSYDLDGDNIYGTFAGISWNDYTNYSGNTISFVNVPANSGANNESGFSASVDSLAGACAGSTGAGVATNSTSQAGVTMLRANVGNSVLHTNGSTISIEFMWHTFQVNSNLAGKTLRVGIMSYCYGSSLSVNPHNQDSGKGLWIAQTAGGTSKSVVAPVSAGLQNSIPIDPFMTFFDIVDAQAGDQYTIYQTKSLFDRSNPQAYLGSISFDVVNTASLPATKPFINNFVTTAFVSPTTVFGTPPNPTPAGGTNYGYTGVIRTNCNFRIGVLAGSGTAATYQWVKSGSPISNATNAIYDIVNANSSDAGNYQVVISNIAGSVTSQVYSVSVMANSVAPQVASYRAKAFATPGLYAYYGFDNGPKDMKGTNDGVFVGSPGIGAQVGTGFGAGAGENDGAGSEMGFFNFGAGAMQIPYNSAFDFNNANQEGTVIMWVRPEWCWTGSYRQSFMMNNGADGNARWGLNMGRTKQGLAAYRYDPVAPTSPLNPISLGTTIPGGQIAASPSIGTKWVMLTAVFSNGLYTAYCNGVPLGSGAGTPATNQPFALGPIVGAPITIGALDGANNNVWNGGLDEIAVYTNALSAAQVKALFDASDLPYVVTNPVGGSFAPGDAYNLSCIASNNWNIWQSSSQPSTVFTPNSLSYQWYTNGVPLSGATSPTLSFASFSTADAATYVCVVTNNISGSVTSSPAVINIAYPQLQVTASEGNATVTWPSSYALTGWFLESTPSLSPSSWSAVATNPPLVLPASGSEQYFRLHEVRP